MKEIKILILKLAAYYEKDISDEQLEIYAEQLSRAISVDQLKFAISKYISDPENEFFPRPISKLISLAIDPLSSQTKAQQIASLVKQAIFEKNGSSWTSGYYWGKHPESGDDLFYFEGRTESFWTWREAAVNYFGESGLALVDHLGGWERLCLTYNESPESVMAAQMLRAAEAVIEIRKMNMQNSIPQLNYENNPVKLISIKEIPE